MLQVRPFLMSLIGFVALSALAPAQSSIPFLARLNGAQETPPNASPARGIGLVWIDPAASTLTFRELFQGLTAAETAAHIHGFSAPGVASGVQFAQALGSPKCGVWPMTPAQQGQVLAGQSYFNVHSAAFGGGEIRGQINLAPDQATYCYGDGSGTACPCGNNSAVGDFEGCLHQPGMGGRLVGYASTVGASISNDNLVLHALRLPASTFVLFFQGTAPMAGGAGLQFGNGLLCVSGTITRLTVKATCNGQVGLPEPSTGDLPISVSGAVVPGTYFYQGWFRTNPGFCSAIQSTFNLTNGVRVNWIP